MSKARRIRRTKAGRAKIVKLENDVISFRENTIAIARKLQDGGIDERGIYRYLTVQRELTHDLAMEVITEITLKK